MRRNPVAVFVSHAASESTIVDTLVEYLRVALPDVSFYLSSSYRSLKPGISWWDDIRSTLYKAKIILACISRHTLAKPWILFESGVGIGCGAVVIPVILDDLPNSQIGPPLSMYQAVRMDKNSLKHLATSIAEITNTRVQTDRLRRKPIPEFSELNVSAGMASGIYCGSKRHGLGGWQRYAGNPKSLRESKAYVSLGSSFEDGFRYPPSDSLEAPFHYWGFRIKRTQGVHVYAVVKCANGLTYKVYVSSNANLWGFISHPTDEFVIPGSSILSNTWQIVIVDISSLQKEFESPIRAIVGFRVRGPLILSHIWCFDDLVQVPKSFIKNATQLVYPGSEVNRNV
jgi:TIR domain-containing protein